MTPSILSDEIKKRISIINNLRHLLSCLRYKTRLINWLQKIKLF